MPEEYHRVAKVLDDLAGMIGRVIVDDDHLEVPVWEDLIDGAADRTGDYVYAGTYWPGTIAQIDVETKTLVKLHEIPNGRWGQPYKPFPDRNHMVWFSMAADDNFGKLNPNTGQITMYPLPSRGTGARHLAVDDSTDSPTVWVPYDNLGKIARVQFRHDTSQ